MMLSIALTGGIGSGKSLVSHIFQILNVPVFNADYEAKKFYSKPDVIDRVTKEFGTEILKGKQIDIKALADIVFNDNSALARLNNIIHPLVLSAYENWCLQFTALSYVLMESAIIFEAKLAEKFDHVITVFAPEELCINRVLLRERTTRDLVVRRLKTQIMPEVKIKESSYIIYNDDEHLVIPQILEIHKKLSG